MLEIKNISKTFNPNTINSRLALNNLSLKVEDGDFITIIGGNGAGKSTLFNAISGVWRLDEGQIIIDGKNITSMPEYKRSKFLGRVFQDPMLGTASKMQIQENLALALTRGKRKRLKFGVSTNDKELILNSIKSLGLGLENRLTAKVGLLSGGQRQALTLLMATIQKPKLLLLDEHTAALDPKTANKVLTLTDKIVKENKISTLMITHNMSDALKYGNRLIMIHEGKIILDIKNEEKQRMQVQDLLDKFNKVAKEEITNDRMLLV